jgi:DNA-binding NarL/FixJ family response regulator
LDVLLVDDVMIHLESLASVLASESRIDNVRTARDLSGALGELEAGSPDLVLLNIAIAGSLELLCTMRATAPTTRLIAIGVSEIEDEVLAFAEAGVHGYLLRSDPLDHLLRLIHTVVAGETLCNPRVTALLLRRVAVLAAERRPDLHVPNLTQREDQVLGLLASVFHRVGEGAIAGTR